MGGSALRQINKMLRLTLTVNQFLEVVGGREVETKIGQTGVTFRREGLPRLHEFAACVNLPVEQPPW